MISSKRARRSFRKRWTNRSTYLFDLLRELVGRDIKLQYKRSVLGIIWSFITPLMQLIVYYFVFGIALAINIPNYAAFMFSGMLVWTWFQMSLFRGASAITENRELVRQPGFPTAILPIVAVVTNLVHFILSLPVLFFLPLFGQRFELTLALFTLPLLVIVQFLFTLGLTYLVAALNVIFRDTQHILGILLNLFFYLNPIFYDTNIVPEAYRSIYDINPMTHLLTAYRAVLLQGELPNGSVLFLLAAFSLGLLLLTYQIFRRASYHFVEEL